MLVLAQSDRGYPDSERPELRYRLPIGLRPVLDPAGVPEAVLSRSSGGGLLHVRLEALWPELSSDELRVPILAGRFRLLARTPAGAETGAWHRAVMGAGAVVGRSLSLSPVEVAIAQRLGQASEDLVELEAELEIQGRLPSFPWRVRAQARALGDRLAALLEVSPASWDAIEAAFLGLGREAFEWSALEPAALPPPEDQALRAIARHCASVLLRRSGEDWELDVQASGPVDISLAVPRTGSRTCALSWSFSEFLSGVADPTRHLFESSIPAPLEAAELHVVNDVPLHEQGIRRIGIEVRTGGPSGRVEAEFLPGGPQSQRLSFVRETFEDLRLTWRARVTVQSEAGPTVVEVDEQPAGLLLELCPQTLGLAALRFAADPDVFSHLERLELQVGRRKVELTRERPEVWVTGRTPPAAVEVTAVLEGNQRKPLGPLPLRAGGLTIGPAEIGAGTLAEVVLVTPDDIERSMAYLAVQVEEGPWRTLDAGVRWRWPVVLESALHEPQVRYRTLHVPLDGNGRSQPFLQSAWRRATGTHVVVVV